MEGVDDFEGEPIEISVDIYDEETLSPTIRGLPLYDTPSSTPGTLLLNEMMETRSQSSNSVDTIPRKYSDYSTASGEGFKRRLDCVVLFFLRFSPLSF